MATRPVRHQNLEISRAVKGIDTIRVRKQLPYIPHHHRVRVEESDLFVLNPLPEAQLDEIPPIILWQCIGSIDGEVILVTKSPAHLGQSVETRRRNVVFLREKED